MLVFAFLQNPVSISYIPGNDLTMRRRTVALKPFNSFMTVWGKHILHLVDNVIRDFETLSWLLDFVKNGPRKKGINFRGCKTFTMCSICVDHKKQSKSKKRTSHTLLLNLVILALKFLSFFCVHLENVHCAWKIRFLLNALSKCLWAY